MNNRRIGTLIALAVMVVALVAPVFMFANRVGSSTPTGASSSLKVLAKSLDGDHRYDEEAAETLRRAKRTVINGNETFILGSAGDCWALTPSMSNQPVESTECSE